MSGQLTDNALCIAGRVTVGAGRDVDIIVQGTGVESLHCHIDNSNGVVTLYPVAEMTSVDGLRVTSATRLTQGKCPSSPADILTRAPPPPLTDGSLETVQSLGAPRVICCLLVAIGMCGQNLKTAQLIHLARARDRWRAPLNTVVNLRVP
jgi:hypothetical protein